jgi:hypothetical protein
MKKIMIAVLLIVTVSLVSYYTGHIIVLVGDSMLCHRQGFEKFMFLSPSGIVGFVEIYLYNGMDAPSGVKKNALFIKL